MDEKKERGRNFCVIITSIASSHLETVSHFPTREMPFTVQIKNLGKLTDATVRVGRMTVLAGPNNTGKSFFSKAMYSVFDAMSANHAEVVISSQVRPLRNCLSRIEDTQPLLETILGKGDKKLMDASLLAAVSVAIDGLIKAARTCSLRDETASPHPDDQPYPLLQQAAAEVEKAYSQFKPNLEDLIASENASVASFFLEKKSTMDRYMDSLHDLGRATAEQLTRQGLSSRVSEDLLENFQIRTLSDLKKNDGENIAVTIGDVGDVIVDSGNHVDFHAKRAGLIQRQYSRVIYLESPVLWKLQTALEEIRNTRDPDAVNSVPGYFYDLASMAKTEYRGSPMIPDAIERLASKIIRGRVLPEKLGGGMVYHEEGGGSYPLSGSAMGVANLGVLAMLVERGVVNQKSLLFIDEPEAHLHPTWQVEMIKLLFALAREGVHVVIATHSVDMVKWLEVHVNKHPEDEQLIELNPFTETGVMNGDADFSEKLSCIMKELTGPFHKLYMSGL